MIALVCDLCGGKLIMGTGGIATCDSCGMEHSANRMKEKIQEIKGTVRVDNSHMIENYLEMAQTAEKSGNYVEAEAYCNKILEIEPNHYIAWMLKGKSVAWQSTLQNSRVDEGINAFTKGINNASESEKGKLLEIAKDEITNLSVAMISLRAERFSKWPDKEETEGFMSDLSAILESVVTFLQQTGSLIPISDIMSPTATKINDSVVKAYKEVIFPEYKSVRYPWPDDDDLIKFLDRLNYCTKLLTKAISICDNDDEDDIPRYNNLIFLHNEAITACSYDWTYADIAGDPVAIKIHKNSGRFPVPEENRVYRIKMQLNDDVKATHRKIITHCENKIKEIKSVAERKAEEEKKQRIKDYWDNHKQEKTALEEETKFLKSQIKQYNDEIVQLQKQKESVPALAQMIQVQKNIKKMEEEKKTLGLFKGKEKKAIQEKIDAQEVDKKRFKQQVNSQQQEIEEKITLIRKKLDTSIVRLQAIEIELTKDRI